MEFISSRSAIRLGPVGSHPSRSRVNLLDAGRSHQAKGPSHPKWADASSCEGLTTGTSCPPKHLGDSKKPARPLPRPRYICCPLHAYQTQAGIAGQHTAHVPPATGSSHPPHTPKLPFLRDLNRVGNEPLVIWIMNLRQAHDTFLCHGNAHQIRSPPRIRMLGIEDLLRRRLSQSRVPHAPPLGDDRRTIRAGEYPAKGLDDPPVQLAHFNEVREVMVERRVDHATRHLRALAQAIEVVEVAPAAAASSAFAPSSDRVSPGTSCIAFMSSGTIPEPITPWRR